METGAGDCQSHTQTMVEGISSFAHCEAQVADQWPDGAQR